MPRLIRESNISLPLSKYDLPIMVLFILLLVGSSLLGPISTLGFVFIGLLVVIARFKYALAGYIINWPLFLYPLLGLISTLWSDYPAVALKYSLQYIVSMLIIITAVYTIPSKKILMAASLALFIVMFLSLFSSQTVTIYTTGEIVRVGLFGSKNNLAIYASFSMVCGAAIIIMSGKTYIKKIFPSFLILLSGAMFLQAKSFGTTVSVFGFMFITFLIYCYSNFRLSINVKALHIYTLTIVLMLSMVTLIVIFDETYFDELMYRLGKDPTLTGRTNIWLIGMETFWLNMWGGVGIGSYFQIDNPGAIEIWESMHKEIGAPFGFHNTYIMGLVELGILGFLVICFLFVKGLQGLYRAVVFDMTKMVAFLTCIFLIVFAKSFLETIGFAQFSFSTFMFCWSWIVLTKGTYFEQRKIIRVVV